MRIAAHPHLCNDVRKLPMSVLRAGKNLLRRGLRDFPDRPSIMEAYNLSPARHSLHGAPQKRRLTRSLRKLQAGLRRTTNHKVHHMFQCKQHIAPRLPQGDAPPPPPSPGFLCLATCCLPPFHPSQDHPTPFARQGRARSERNCHEGKSAPLVARCCLT